MPLWRVWSASKNRHPRLVEAESQEEALAKVSRSKRADQVRSTSEWDEFVQTNPIYKSRTRRR